MSPPLSSTIVEENGLSNCKRSSCGKLVVTIGSRSGVIARKKMGIPPGGRE